MASSSASTASTSPRYWRGNRASRSNGSPLPMAAIRWLPSTVKFGGRSGGRNVVRIQNVLCKGAVDAVDIIAHGGHAAGFAVLRGNQVPHIAAHGKHKAALRLDPLGQVVQLPRGNGGQAFGGERLGAADVPPPARPRTARRTCPPGRFRPGWRKIQNTCRQPAIRRSRRGPGRCPHPPECRAAIHSGWSAAECRQWPALPACSGNWMHSFRNGQRPEPRRQTARRHTGPAKTAFPRRGRGYRARSIVSIRALCKSPRPAISSTMQVRA